MQTSVAENKKKRMTYPYTYIDPNARIASGVKIDPFTVIHGDVEIGEGCWIGSNVTIMDGTRIGKNCKIFPGAVLGAIPQDLKYSGEKTIVVIGDNTTIREFVTVHKGTFDRMQTTIGEDCLIMAYSHIAHDCLIGDHCVISNSVQLAGHVVVDDWVWIAGVAAVHQFVHIGKHAYIAGGSLVGKDVPPYIKAVRNPLCYGGINSVGLKRRGFDPDTINRILDIYRVLFNKGLNTTQALDEIEVEILPSAERTEIVTFIRESERGIIKHYNKPMPEEDDME